MPKITAYKCHFTGKLFESPVKFADHLKILRRQQRSDRKQRRLQRDMIAKFRAIRERVRTFEQLESEVIKNWNLFTAVAKQQAWPDQRKAKWPRIVDFKIENPVWSNKVRNTHSASLGRQRNWSGKTDLPTGYPGWTATLKFSLDDETPSFASNYFEHEECCINTGSGGSWGRGNHGSHSYSYGLSLFAEDWPGLAADKVWEVLKEPS